MAALVTNFPISTRNPKTQPPSYYDSTFQCLWHNYFLTKDDDLKVDSDQC